MQTRHTDRYQYFNEEAKTTEKYFMPYIEQWSGVKPQSVLEVGCGEGGNLLPFAVKGCSVMGVDMCEGRVEQAEGFFKMKGEKGTFICSDILKFDESNYHFDLIILHDVIEHISNKTQLLSGLKRYLNPGGTLFVAFPAWQMPFGGHQQIANGRIVSHLPFIHLLPRCLYKLLLSVCGENESIIKELLNIKETRCPIEKFRSIAAKTGYKIVNQQLYFINPHYETKFGLRPRKLNKAVSAVPYLRNFFSTSCFYILKK